MLETKKKTLIACPTCEAVGLKSILGEIGTAGDFIVQRFHQGFTIIKSPNFAVVCGNCGGTCYIKNGSESHIHLRGTVVQYLYVGSSQISPSISSL